MAFSTADEPRLRVAENSIPDGTRPRASVRGKFLFAGERKLYLRGVTYGTFAPDPVHGDYPGPELLDADFAEMAAAGINTVRVYTVPPRRLLDAALRHGIRVMVGLPWEQHVAFLDERDRRDSIERRVREGVRACAGHPAVLAYAVGNEIPASIVRWYGARRVERFLERLYRACKEEDPEALVTYVNFPPTEYLDLEFADFLCFNVYLESRDRLEAYLARLQNLAGERPLVMAEIGLDSRRNGEGTQAEVLEWQIEAIFAGGAAGAFLFAWTDEWHRGGFDIEDWDFGLTDRERRPKPALDAVRHAYARVPHPAGGDWPKVSVVVCSCNGASTIDQTLTALDGLYYPDYEVIVVDDGSTDDTAAIAALHAHVRLISTANRGLSAARNTGAGAATGEIVAYIDDDAWPDPHWLYYAVRTMIDDGHGCIGGPNVAPGDDGPIADCVANAPGGPIHVLLSDRLAEHVPGCNLIVRRSVLDEVGGFDPRYRAAGDDVDFCWRVQEAGHTIGFAPAAMVWHRRRNSVRAYWRQQRGYGRAEALLEEKWPERYNCLGHLSWGGRLYGRGLTHAIRRRRRIRHGTWGSALFQSVYQEASGDLAGMLLMPESYLLIALLAALSGASLALPALRLALPVLGVAVLLTVLYALASAARASFRGASRRGRVGRHLLTALLYLMQPAARLRGRLAHGLTPWRRRVEAGLSLPRRRTLTIWSETWRSCEERLEELERDLRLRGATVSRGGEFDRWDLEVRAGLLGRSRLRVAIEEHGGGKQLVRVRSWARWSQPGRVIAAAVAVPAVVAGLAGATLDALILSAVTVTLLALTLEECAIGAAAVEAAVAERPHHEGHRVQSLVEERA